MLYSSVDPSGEYSVSLEPPCNSRDDVGDTCICKSIKVDFMGGKNKWQYYKHEGKWRAGHQIRSIFMIEGNVEKCTYHQDEEGFGRIVGNQRPPKDRAPNFPDENDDIWKGDDAVEYTGKPNEIKRDNKNAKFSQENQRVVYVDPLGQNVDNGFLSHLWIDLKAKVRCVGTDGKELSETFTFKGKLSVYPRGTASTDNWEEWNKSASTTSSTDN